MIRTSYALNKLLTTIARRHETRTALADGELQGHRLHDEEREALRRGDVGALYALGANPYLIRRVFRGNFKV